MPEQRSNWNKTNQWDDEIDLLKSIIAKTGLVETTKWGGPVYTFNKKNVAGIGGFKSYVGIWFWNGVFLKDEAQKLISANEGVTKGLRQWRFGSKAEIEANEKLIVQYIGEAIENEKAGLSIKPEKKETVLSDFFQKALDSDSEFASAFSAFTPFKQREFIEFVDTARRDETKIARMQKIIPLVKLNVGLNDKYRQP